MSKGKPIDVKNASSFGNVSVPSERPYQKITLPPILPPKSYPVTRSEMTIADSTASAAASTHMICQNPPRRTITIVIEIHNVNTKNVLIVTTSPPNGDTAPGIETNPPTNTNSPANQNG